MLVKYLILFKSYPPQEVKIGQQLRIDGLVNRTLLNGQLVIVQTLPDDAGRVTVLQTGKLLRLHMDRLVHPVRAVPGPTGTSTSVGTPNAHTVNNCDGEIQLGCGSASSSEALQTAMGGTVVSAATANPIGDA